MTKATDPDSLGFAAFLRAPGPETNAPPPDADSLSQTPASDTDGAAGNASVSSDSPAAPPPEESGQAAGVTGHEPATAPAPSPAEPPAPSRQDRPAPDGTEAAAPAASPEPGAEAKPGEPEPPWERDENPYKKRVAEWERRYGDTRSWARQVEQSNAELRRQVALLGKKIDGTYDPEVDEPAQPSADEVGQQAELMGRVQASIAMANQAYGQEDVQKLLFSETAPYRQLEEQDPAVRARVMASPAPALEAMRVLQERAFFERYGSDPATVREKIRAEMKAELDGQVGQMVEQKLKERVNLMQQSGSNLGDARGNGEPPPNKDARPSHSPLSQLGNPGLR